MISRSAVATARALLVPSRSSATPPALPAEVPHDSSSRRSSRPEPLEPAVHSEPVAPAGVKPYSVACLPCGPDQSDLPEHPQCLDPPAGSSPALATRSRPSPAAAAPGSPRTAGSAIREERPTSSLLVPWRNHIPISHTFKQGGIRRVLSDERRDPCSAAVPLRDSVSRRRTRDGGGREGDGERIGQQLAKLARFGRFPTSRRSRSRAGREVDGIDHLGGGRGDPKGVRFRFELVLGACDWPRSA